MDDHTCPKCGSILLLVGQDKLNIVRSKSVNAYGYTYDEDYTLVEKYKCPICCTNSVVATDHQSDRDLLIY